MLMCVWGYNKLDEQEKKGSKHQGLEEEDRSNEKSKKNIYDILEAMTNESKVKYLLNDYIRNDTQQEKLQKGHAAGDTDKEQVKLQETGERN